MYWGIYDNYMVRHYEPKGKAPILIRLLEPSYKERGIPYKIRHINKYVNILELYFDDITRDIPEKYQGRYTLFNESTAKEIISFITNNIYDEIVVHCNAGISRSSAIMVCIAKALSRKDIVKEIYDSRLYLPNPKIIEVFDNFMKLNPTDLKDKISELQEMERGKDGDTKIKLSSEEREKINKIVNNMIVI